MSYVGNLIKFSLCIAIFAVSYVELFFKTGYKQKPSRVTVPRIHWSADKPFSDYLESQSTPLILENSVVRSWEAFSKWSSVKKLSRFVQGSHLDNIFHHNVNNGQVFGPFFDTTRPLASLTRPINPYKVDGRLSMKELIRVFGDEFEYSCVNETSSPHQHLSGCWAFSGSVMDAIGDENMIEPLEELLKLNPSASSVNLWVGQRGVTTPCHFDGYHNMYVQIAGSKRFILYPPADLVHLRSYPFLHPSYAQCQSPLPRQLLSPVIAELGVGDLLYIPPFWTHEVTATTSSISVNVWTVGKDEAVIAKVLAVPLPTILTSLSDDETKAEMGARLIAMFLSAYFDSEASKNALLSQLKGRYEGLSDLSSSECPQWRWCQSSWMDFRKEWTGPLSVYTSTVMEILLALSPGGRDSNSSPWIANYVEFLAANAVQLPLVAAFVLQLPNCI